MMAFAILPVENSDASLYLVFPWRLEDSVYIGLCVLMVVPGVLTVIFGVVVVISRVVTVIPGVGTVKQV